MRIGFLISGYIPTTLGASSAIDMNSSKVIIGNIPEEHTTRECSELSMVISCPKDNTFL